MFCSAACRAESHRGSIPETVQIAAAAKRAARTEANRRAKVKRDQVKANRERHAEEQRLQFESEAPIRAKLIAHIEMAMTDLIERDLPEHAEGHRKSMAEQIERARTGLVPPGIRRMLEK